MNCSNECFSSLGNNGYPVTHFWVHQEDGIYFESKGTHDHFRPQARRATPDKISSSKQNNVKQETEQQEITADKIQVITVTLKESLYLLRHSPEQS